MTTKLLTIAVAALILGLVFELIRREKLTFKYAIGWIFVSVLAIVLAVFDRVIFDVAFALGFELASNFVFFTLLAVFVFLTLLLTVFLCQQNSRNDKMAQALGRLEEQLRELKK